MAFKAAAAKSGVPAKMTFMVILSEAFSDGLLMVVKGRLKDWVLKGAEVLETVFQTAFKVAAGLHVVFLPLFQFGFDAPLFQLR